MNQFEALKAFCAVYQYKSFADAARYLNVSTTMVSRYIKQIEGSLGCLLFKRNTRQVHATQAGHQYFAKVKPLILALDTVNQEMMQFGEIPTGRLAVSSSLEFGSQYLAPVIAEYRKQYDNVDLEVHLSNQLDDVWEDKIDLALRIAPSLPESGFIAQPIAHSRLCLWASPDYLSAFGTPETVSSLAEHQLLFFTHSVRVNQWIFSDKGKHVEHKFPWAWRSNNGRLLNEAAKEGQGIIQAPSYSVAQYVKRGQLVELLPEYRIDKLTISAVYPHSNKFSITIKTFVEALKAHFAKHVID